MPRAHVIVVGNEKGGSGKSTTAMHLIVALLRQGVSVASIDLDIRQATMTRYFANRQHYCARRHVTLPLPEHFALPASVHDAQGEMRDRAQADLIGLVDDLIQRFEMIVIDTPGADSFLSRVGHSFADTLITPMNDSWLDLDLLAKVDGQTLRVIEPSLYSEMVWDQRKARLGRDGQRIDWIVMRNRLSALDARNKRDIEKVMERLARRLSFRIAPGFSERVIFRELFLDGLTLLDLRDAGLGFRLNLSHVTARREIRTLLASLGLGAVALLDSEEAEAESAATPDAEDPAIVTSEDGSTSVRSQRGFFRRMVG